MNEQLYNWAVELVALGKDACENALDKLLRSEVLEPDNYDRLLNYVEQVESAS